MILESWIPIPSSFKHRILSEVIFFNDEVRIVQYRDEFQIEFNFYEQSFYTINSSEIILGMTFKVFIVKINILQIEIEWKCILIKL